MSRIPINGPDHGFDMSNFDVRLENAEGSEVAAGLVVAINKSVDSTTGLPDKFVLPNAGDEIDGVQVGIMGVLLSTTANGAKGMVRIQGIVDAMGGDTAALGSGLQAGTDGELVEATTVEKCVAFNLETNADGVRKKVIFDGLSGFGVSGT